MRTHVNWSAPAVPLAWAVLEELRAEWRGKVSLQLAVLAPLDLLVEAGETIARRVALDGGALGAFIHHDPGLDAKVSKLFDLAERHDLALDLQAQGTPGLFDLHAHPVDSLLEPAQHGKRFNPLRELRFRPVEDAAPALELLRRGLLGGACLGRLRSRRVLGFRGLGRGGLGGRGGILHGLG